MEIRTQNASGENVLEEKDQLLFNKDTISPLNHAYSAILNYLQTSNPEEVRFSILRLSLTQWNVFLMQGIDYKMTKFSVDVSSDRLAINGGLPLRSREWKGNFTTGEEEVAAACGYKEWLPLKI